MVLQSYEEDVKHISRGTNNNIFWRWKGLETVLNLKKLGQPFQALHVVQCQQSSPKNIIVGAS